MILYENYRLSFMEKIEIIGKCLLRIILLAYFFYGAIWVGILLSPVFLLFYKEEKEKKKSGNRTSAADKAMTSFIGTISRTIGSTIARNIMGSIKKGFK